VPAYKSKPARLVKGLHTPIVSEHEYWQAERLLKKKNPAISKRDEVYQKGVLNDYAGKKMTAGNSKGKSKSYWYYVSPTSRKHFSAIKIHNQFHELLETLSFLDQEQLLIPVAKTYPKQRRS
jgi:site-specific DNA recombinase